MLAVRYVVLPQINVWRPLVERQLTGLMGSRALVGDISASWAGLNPTLTIENVHVENAEGQTLLRVPKAFAIVSWRSIFALDLRLQLLEISGLDLSVERLADGSLSVAGYRMPLNSTAPLTLGSDTLAVNWLLGQGKVLVHDSSVRWLDTLRGAPELKLTDLDMALTNGLFSHRFLLRASPPEQIAKKFELIVRDDHMLGRLGVNAGRHAEVYVDVEDVEPQALAPWMDLPVVYGRFAARAWIDLQQGKLGNTELKIAGAKIGLPVSAQTAGMFAERAQIHVTGLLGDMLPMFPSALLATSSSAGQLDLDAALTHAEVDSKLFEPSLMALGDVSFTLKLKPSATASLSAHVTNLTISNSDLKMNLQGDWQAGGDSAAGIADLKGSIERLSAPQLYRYLTTQTNREAREWLRDSLVQGQFNQVALTLKGDLSHFPFNAPSDTGVFRLEGGFRNLSLDYAPLRAGIAGWPALAEAQGAIIIDKLSLTMQTKTGALFSTAGERIGVQSLKASIPDMALNPLLSIDMALQGEAKSFLAVMRESPVNEQSGLIFNSLSASGSFEVPLSIRADLNQLQALQAKGQIKFSGSDVSWGTDKKAPKLENIQGTLGFVNSALHFDQLNAKLLGEPVLIQGSIGEPTSKGITVEGSFAAGSLAGLTKSPALLALEGRTKYRAQINQNNKDGVEVQVSSSLEGLSLALPSPIGKTAAQKSAFSLKWSSTKQRNDYRHSLLFSIGDVMSGRFERQPEKRTASFFTQAAVVMGTTSLVLPAAGMTIDLALGEVNWADWKTFSDKLSEDARVQSQAKNSQALLPQIQRVALRTPRLTLDDLVFSELSVAVQQVEKGQWTAKIESRETAGNISWQESSAGVSGRVAAQFSKLELGRAPADSDTPPKIETMNETEWSNIPAVDLRIDDFTMFGSRLGALHLSGANVAPGDHWKIDSIEVKNPHATLTASGEWRLSGESRGVHLNAELAIDDLGKMTTYMGYPDKVREGSGTVKAEVDWKNFPWMFTYEGMSGTARVDMKNGVFEHVNSRSARLLELLSLQSLQRILSFNFRPSNEFKDGFPWLSIDGDFLIKQGVASTADLTISSPVASILLSGNSDLSRKTWNMDADVKPRFDMSGTAVATGFVVNPLVGLSALVTQFLLRNPIERAMTAKYQVRGPWDDPTLIPVEDPAPKAGGLTPPPSPGN